MIQPSPLGQHFYKYILTESWKIWGTIRWISFMPFAPFEYKSGKQWQKPLGLHITFHDELQGHPGQKDGESYV